MKKLRQGFNFWLVVIFSLTIVACTDQSGPIAGQLDTVSAVASGQNNTTATSVTSSVANVVATATLAQAIVTPTAIADSATPALAFTPTPTLAPTATPNPTAPSGSNMAGSPAAAHATMVATGSLNEVLRGKTGKKEIAITLDAGASAVAFPKEIAALDKYNIKLTFFLTGAWVRENPQYAQQIAKDGMEIANHTYDHPSLTKASNAKVTDEIVSAEKEIEAVTGVNPKPLFRFPYGDYDARTMKILNGLGYRSIYWTYDSLDSVGGHKTAAQLIKIVTSISDAHLDGAILLMHLGNDTSGDALGPIIANLEGRGFKIVTVSELIR